MPVSDPFASLPAISFCNVDVAALQQAVILGFQQAWASDTGENLVLFPSDRRYNFLMSLVAYLVQERLLIDQSAKMNLIAFSQNNFLDQLGAIFGPRAKRLPASGAITQLQFTLPAPSNGSQIIPQGTQVASQSTQLIFSTDYDITLPAGFIQGYADATCPTTGTVGNNLPVGDVTTIVGWNAAFSQTGVTASNVNVSQGGADLESDYNYSRRL